MNYRLPFTKIYPAGNMTALVKTRLPRRFHGQIARQIMKEDKSVEQVGFIEPARNPRALARLQMMGGEFCGNATRSLAMCLFNELRTQCNIIKRKFSLEVSGMDKLIEVSIQENNSVQISLPVNHYNDELFRTCKNGTLVRLDGIQHFVSNLPRYVTINQELLKLRGYYELKNEGLFKYNVPAIGTIFLQRIEGGIKIYPLIYVHDTKTFIFESGCASGTLAAGLIEAKLMGDGVHTMNVLQPSGLFLTTTITQKTGRFQSAFLSGMVEIKESSYANVSVKEEVPQFAYQGQTLPAVL